MVKYNTLVIDPPFDISMTGKISLRPNRARKLPYKTMTLKEIKDFPLKDFLNPGGHVYMWTTNKMLRYTWEIFKSWGVNYHLTLVWVKPTSIAPCFAYKFSTEFLILGFFGRPMLKFNKKVNLNWLKCNSSKHSTKPEEFYNLIKEMSPGPLIDIFARRKIKGFDSWGDEV